MHNVKMHEHFPHGAKNQHLIVGSGYQDFAQLFGSNAPDGAIVVQKLPPCHAQRRLQAARLVVQPPVQYLAVASAGLGTCVPPDAGLSWPGVATNTRPALPHPQHEQRLYGLKPAQHAPSA